MKALVLAAGYGKRLLPLTQTLPKPMFPIMNRPIMAHTLALLRSNGINDIVANLHHLPQKITDYFGDGSSFGVRLRYSMEKSILGTGGGIKAAQKLLGEDGAFLVINSDILVDIDLQTVIEFHKQKKSLLTLVLRRDSQPEKFEPIEMDSDGRIIHFPGVSTAPVSEKTMMFTGIQIMEPEMFSHIPSDGFCGTAEDVFPKMIRQGLPIYGYPHTGYWSDLGSRENYLQTHWDVLDGKIAVDGQAGSRDINNPAITPPVFIGNDCQISASAQVGPYVVLGNACKVGDGAVIEHSVCWEGADIGNSASVRQCIIGNGRVVGDSKEIVEQSLAER